MKYALLNTDKNRFIAPHGTTQLWSTYEDARRECETHDDHVEVRAVAEVYKDSGIPDFEVTRLDVRRS